MTVSDSWEEKDVSKWKIGCGGVTARCEASASGGDVMFVSWMQPRISEASSEARQRPSELFLEESSPREASPSPQLLQEKIQNCELCD